MQKSKGVEQLSSSYSIGAAVEFLEENLKDIPDVKTWAERMGYSRSHFSSQIKECYGKAPSIMLREVRMEHLCQKIPANSRKTSTAIAQMVGLKDDDSLYQFLSNHYGTNFTELREKLLSCDEF